MRILIVGLGVIGGGYAMALKEAGYSEVYGVDNNIETLKKAKALGIIKEGYEDEKDIIQNADLIVLAIYPNLVKDFIINNKEYFKDGTVITDVTGIKHKWDNWNITRKNWFCFCTSYGWEGKEGHRLCN